MFLEQKSTGNLIEIVKTEDLSDPSCGEVEGRSHAGEEMQEVEAFAKEDLKFPSGETLPICWLDPNYRASAPTVSSSAG
ncbi:acetyltransferase [Laspinema sp. A4]|uniref:acetyltransferase n=1 Tax=Laspinema sp. D2d TaxID=2953686 RepID=UPI0021BAFBF3|nr:acetyltransferase [Laspinema sp. D2d]MCT7982725.1 acetyltransferase [Laspinema sp. D2d]